MESKLNEKLLSEQDNSEQVANTEKYISQYIKSSNFDRLNYIISKEKSGLSGANLPSKDTVEFISVNKDVGTPYYNLMSEKEFFKVVGFTKNHISSRSGNYQKSLYGHYLQAKAEKDIGYLGDVLKKAIVLRNNINHVKTLMHDKTFMKKWHRNFGHKSPMAMLKNSGEMTIINIVNAE